MSIKCQPKTIKLCLKHASRLYSDIMLIKILVFNFSALCTLNDGLKKERTQVKNNSRKGKKEKRKEKTNGAARPLVVAAHSHNISIVNSRKRKKNY